MMKSALCMSEEDRETIRNALLLSPVEERNFSKYVMRTEMDEAYQRALEESPREMNGFNRQWDTWLPRMRSVLQSNVENAISPVAFVPRWNVVAQSRPGAHHGQGGRRRLGNAAERRARIPKEVCSLLCTTLSKIMSAPIRKCIEIAIKILLDVEELPQNLELDNPELPWNLNTSYSISRSFEVLHCPFFAACHKIAYSGLQRKNANVMERHYCCFWIDFRGCLLCTCVGSTAFRSVHLLETVEENILRCECVHTEGLLLFLRAISKLTALPVRVIGTAISTIFEQYSNCSIGSYRLSLPKVVSLHKGSVRIVESVVAGEEFIIFTPVRSIHDNNRFICCFCDTSSFGNCYHVQECQRINSEEDSSFTGEVDRTGLEMPSSESTYQGISRLPLSPVNCRRAIEVDMEVNRIAIEKGTFLLSSPTICDCGYPVISSSRRLHCSGIVMATIGPCLMHVEEFICGNPSGSHKVTPEGRANCILLLNLSTAATHTLLRRELSGVIMGNGTLSGRMKHYHALSMENVLSGYLNPLTKPRSVRTLIKLCTEMLRLMSLKPTKSLFECGVCDKANGRDKRVEIVCIDGIYQGYMRKKQVKSNNIYEKVQSFPVSSSTSGTSWRRPNIHFIRKSRVSAILFTALSGKEIACSSMHDANDISSAIRLVSTSILPDYFCVGSVCGRNQYDYMEDIGSHSVLQGINTFISSLFDSNVVISRLIRPLYSFITRSIRLRTHAVELKRMGVFGRALSPHSTSIPRFANYRRPVRPIIEVLSELLSVSDDDSEGLCWISGVASFFSSQKNWKVREQEIFNLFKLFIQGPITQFVLQRHIVPLRCLSEICLSQPLTPLKEVLLGSSCEIDEYREARGFVMENRFVRAGLLSILQLEEMTRNCGMIAREAFGNILSLAERLVGDYYAFYDSTSADHSSVTYARKWQTTSTSSLTQEMSELNSMIPVSEGHSLFDYTCRTGSFFPARKQIRPLPFNSAELDIAQQSQLGLCAKDYLQHQKTYTPGAIIVSCSCPKSICFGFKTLCRNEGPKSVLDTIVTRFSETPKFVIYDFACGLYASAVHSLWWALRDTTIVTDNFHLKNHTKCSPGYSPKCHTGLDNSNTVAHEQNNRAINALARSLRNSSQETYVGLLTYLLTIENIRAKTRRSELYSTVKNNDDFDLHWCFYVCLSQTCTCCSG